MVWSDLLFELLVARQQVVKKQTNNKQKKQNKAQTLVLFDADWLFVCSGVQQQEVKHTHTHTQTVWAGHHEAQTGN